MYYFTVDLQMIMRWRRRTKLLQFNKVVVIGLGQLGLPVAKYIKQKEKFDTYGYDISTKAIDRAQKTVGIKRADDHFSEFDVFIICISTHKPDDIFSPQTDGLLSIVEKISKEAKDGALVSIESTIPKGTSRKVLEMLNHRLHVAHAPHRWYELEQEKHGVNQLRVLGGVYIVVLEQLCNFTMGEQKNKRKKMSVRITTVIIIMLVILLPLLFSAALLPP